MSGGQGHQAGPREAAHHNTSLPKDSLRNVGKCGNTHCWQWPISSQKCVFVPIVGVRGVQTSVGSGWGGEYWASRLCANISVLLSRLVRLSSVLLLSRCSSSSRSCPADAFPPQPWQACLGNCLTLFWYVGVGQSAVCWWPERTCGCTDASSRLPPLPHGFPHTSKLSRLSYAG